MTEKSESWSCLLENGGSYYRVDRTFASRREIVDLLAGKGAGGWERNFIDSKLKPGETSSGQWQQELAREQQKWERERQELREEMREALRKSDRDAEEALRRERERSSIKVKRAEEHHQAMQSILEDRLDRCKEDAARLKAEMEQLETSHQQRIRHNTKQHANLKEQNVDLQEKILGLSIQDERVSTGSSDDEQPSTIPVPLRYCMSIDYRRYHFLRGPGSVFLNLPPDDSVGDLVFISAADHSSICRFACTGSKDVWTTNGNVHKSHPYLAEEFCEEGGLQNLDRCYLGLDGNFFAQWQDGSRLMGGNTTFLDTIISSDQLVQTGAFGFGGSCLFSYGTRGDWPTYWFDSQGYYPELSNFLSSCTRYIRILAISLDLHSPTDFVVVIGEPMDDGGEEYYCYWNLSDEEIDEAISNWWQEEDMRLNYLKLGRLHPQRST